MTDDSMQDVHGSAAPSREERLPGGMDGSASAKETSPGLSRSITDQSIYMQSSVIVYIGIKKNALCMSDSMDPGLPPCRLRSGRIHALSSRRSRRSR